MCIRDSYNAGPGAVQDAIEANARAEAKAAAEAKKQAAEEAKRQEAEARKQAAEALKLATAPAPVPAVEPVSYTHLDVYKRQHCLLLILRPKDC